MAIALSLDFGALYAGVYEIGERLGVGGTGTVYRARHVVLQQERALKVLHAQTFRGPGFLERLQLEASVFGRLKGESTLVMPFDLGFDPATATHFLAMELLEGCDLAAWVHAQGPLDVGTTLRLMRQVARGLDAAHGYVNPQGQRTPIVHRDLTPRNVFVVKPEHGVSAAKILDFGLADMLDQASHMHGRRSGTPLYRSYEQEQGLEVVPQTDIWALGLVTHFALTGTAYWLSRQSDELHEEITRAPLEPPSSRLRQRFASVQLPAAFDDWFMRCLRRLPSRRFTSAGEAVDELALCFGSDFDLRTRVVHLERASLGVPGKSGEASVSQSQTVSRIDETHHLDPHSASAILADYLKSVHPLLKGVVRLGDDLMTATGHYLAFAPDSFTSLHKQLEGVGHAIALYNAASARMRGPIGNGAFSHGIEAAMTGEVSVLIGEPLSALLALPERYSDPKELIARRSASALQLPKGSLRSEDAAPQKRPAPDALLEYCVHSTHWQTERVRLYAHVEVAKRAIVEAERRVENWLVTETPHSHAWFHRAQAVDTSEKLIRGYVDRTQSLATAIGDWLQVLDEGADGRTTEPLQSEEAEPTLTQAAWRLAAPIEAMNSCYVELEERSLELRVALLGGEAAGYTHLAQTLSDIEVFQWYQVRPQLNGLIVSVIRLLCAQDPAHVAPLLSEDRVGWERLRQLLARVRFDVRG